MDLFLELAQVSLGSRNDLSRIPSAREWTAIYEESERQTISGVMLDGLEQLPVEQRPPQELLLQWIGVVQLIERRNVFINNRCRELQRMFVKDGFRCCLLKGQGNALLYPNPLSRQCGDIDIWVESDKCPGVKKTVEYLASKCSADKLNVVYHHTEFSIWDDVEVEVHWRPSWRACPWYNKRMQQWFKEQADEQFAYVDAGSGLHIPTWEFNVVYQIQHMFLHVMQEGMGLRQIIDYYYLLKSKDRNKDVDAIPVLKYLGLYEFAGAVMYVLREACGIASKYLICPVDERRGQHLLDEIMLSGNFGHKDKRNVGLHQTTGTQRSLGQLNRKWRFLRDYPVEVLSGPFQVYHVIWRKLKLWRWE